MISFLKNVIICLSIIGIYSCSDDGTTSNNDQGQVIPSGFVINEEITYFINHDETINIEVTGAFSTGNDLNGEVLNRGFVYGTSTNPVVDATNTVPVSGAFDAAMGKIVDLPKNQIYYIRGFFEIDDGTYFYGNEIEASTAVNASNTRSIVMEIRPTPFFVNSNTITPTIDITELEKESPNEIGIEYSTHNDFSDSVMASFTPVASGLGGNFRVDDYSVIVIEGLTPATLYYMKPYAIYADGITTNGGTNTVSISTSN